MDEKVQIDQRRTIAKTPKCDQGRPSTTIDQGWKILDVNLIRTLEKVIGWAVERNYQSQSSKERFTFSVRSHSSWFCEEYVAKWLRGHKCLRDALCRVQASIKIKRKR